MTLCTLCRQPLTPRHGHPHDHVGPLTGPCLACNKVHPELCTECPTHCVTEEDAAGGTEVCTECPTHCHD